MFCLWRQPANPFASFCWTRAVVPTFLPCASSGSSKPPYPTFYRTALCPQPPRSHPHPRRMEPSMIVWYGCCSLSKPPLQTLVLMNQPSVCPLLSLLHLQVQLLQSPPLARLVNPPSLPPPMSSAHNLTLTRPFTILYRHQTLLKKRFKVPPKHFNVRVHQRLSPCNIPLRFSCPLSLSAISPPPPPPRPSLHISPPNPNMPLSLCPPRPLHLPSPLPGLPKTHQTPRLLQNLPIPNNRACWRLRWSVGLPLPPSQCRHRILQPVPSHTLPSPQVLLKLLHLKHNGRLRRQRPTHLSPPLLPSRCQGRC
mmetsp:Transcript_27884/g.45274  ORF Transcript_27884/g.45274 Transcript_27884/m.45274 type:complete len:309 (+) Transcript_27884:671-1597(+)